ncbi:MAG: nuclear transport factor 2 family protein [Novosphingobium sp.]|nr:nuclear transport factor 2 family protein [Novosphingobium sp.]
MARSNRTVEERLQELEDRDAIRQIVSAYSYSVDGCNAESVGSLYTEQGVYAVGDMAPFVGRAQVAAITADQGHLDLVAGGCAHISLPPYIEIDGDLAVATCHTMVARNGDDGFWIWRLSASRLELVREADGEWRIERRENWLLDGNPDASKMLGDLRKVRRG